MLLNSIRYVSMDDRTIFSAGSGRCIAAMDSKTVKSVSQGSSGSVAGGVSRFGPKKEVDSRKLSSISSTFCGSLLQGAIMWPDEWCRIPKFSGRSSLSSDIVFTGSLIAVLSDCCTERDFDGFFRRRTAWCVHWQS